MAQYYLHSIAQNYKKYGILPPGDQGKSPTVQQIYSQQKENLKSQISKLRGSEQEATELTEFFNAAKKGGTVKGGLTAEQKRMILDAIQEKVGVEVTETLNVSDKDRNANARLKQNFDRHIKKFITPSSKEKSVSVKEVDRMMETLRQALSNSKDHSRYKKFSQALKRLEQMQKQLQTKKYGSGQGYIIANKEDKDFIKLLNSLYTNITLGAISNKIGDIGELYGAAAAYVFYHQKAKNTNEILEQFLKGFQSGQSKIVGADKSAAYYEDEDAFGPGGVQVKDADGNNIGYRLNYTQDKVDFQIDVPDQGLITFSAKNYADTSILTILSGNLYPILEENKPMLYHLMNLLTVYNDGYSNIGSQDYKDMYEVAKLTVGIKALIGGVRALSQDNQLIHTATADYFLINNNKTGHTKVYQMKQICEKIEDQLNLIIMEPDSLAQQRPIQETNFKARFSNAHVSLHLGELKKTI